MTIGSCPSTTSRRRRSNFFTSPLASCSTSPASVESRTSSIGRRQMAAGVLGADMDSDEKIGITFIRSAGSCILSNVISTFLISYGFASSSFIMSNVDSTLVSYSLPSSKFVAIIERSSVEVEEAYHHETLRKKLGRREEW
ncbi:hypothetical protein E2562_032060 [Oryza meyeriana var. granulata]|uniref:Uncharacterized protein n=1 Tax=Oryza meyeriana var. granulata TaxID=110450 RepID=A0A6G1CJW2_9ORYZ|nr:hypothetical protein E2562_032060 [Oryza meyeriana var. granulata]